MSPRITTRHQGIASNEAFIHTIDQIAQLDVRIRILTSRLDKKVQTIREQHEPEILSTRDQRDALLTLAEAYAHEHRDELFSRDRKSNTTNLASYGLRLGQPTLKTLNRRWTWAKVLEAVRAAFPAYIRKKEEVDKDSIRAQLGHDAATLATIGLRIDQTEAFWVEPKDDSTES